MRLAKSQISPTHSKVGALAQQYNTSSAKKAASKSTSEFFATNSNQTYLETATEDAISNFSSQLNKGSSQFKRNQIIGIAGPGNPSILEVHEDEIAMAD